MTEVNNDILKAHIRYYKNESKRYKKEIGKLKRTLKEIKDTAKEDFNHTCWKTYARQLKQILQLIRESEIKYES